MAVMDALDEPVAPYMETHLPDLMQGLESVEDMFFLGEYDAMGAIWCVSWHAVAPFNFALWKSDIDAWRQEQDAWYTANAENPACKEMLLVWADPDPDELRAEILALLERNNVALVCETILYLPGEQERDDAHMAWFHQREDARWGDDDSAIDETGPQTYEEWEAAYQAEHPEIDWGAYAHFHEVNW